ncbi:MULTISPECIES: hypothetical protein [unclassified Mesorhizobium]|uniref:hypothetical protein n=1 Tax=unclassified Mesorhizobium TaxID=325217 RepID=UPI00096A1124|nr:MULTISPECIES: hypothetical protein [unclassified Mesorhizobium]MBN9254817.1 hypothetical protein [Mesorhizobium sp.]OJX72046.1 MAG: hypothetical protein BGO93_15515 [Mesorhizobium sp. 65-26]
MTAAADVQTFISQHLHSLLFLEEFTFARTTFKPPASSEVEFADAVVMLGDVLLIYQIKERASADAGDAEAERRWFENKVRGKAVKQVRETLRYLRSCPDIPVPNERGRIFNLAATAFKDVLKVVIYLPSPNLPEDCRRLRHHVSKTEGFIHIIDAGDYLELSRLLRVPEEVVRYFRYREMVLTEFANSAALSEAAIVGHFIGGDPNLAPTASSADFVRRLIDDEHEWNLAPFLRGLHNHLSVPELSDDYYDILLEFAKLPRSAWRAVKERIKLCVEKTQKGEFAQPYRFTFPATGCGFVFIPADPEWVAHQDWPVMRVRGLRQLVEAHKYDRRLSKCVGILVAKDGEYFDILWCLVAHAWMEDPEYQRILESNFPFREVKGRDLHGYQIADDRTDP